MKISIITVVKNGMPHLKECVHSIKKQKYKSIEHIIIYSKSTDKTLEFLKKNKVKFYYDKKSKNKFDAINVGIKKARGKYIALLHADDLFYNNKVISNIYKKLKKYNPDVLYGDIIYVNQKDISQIIRKWNSKKFDKSLLRYGWMPPHTSLFVKRKIILNNLYGNHFPISGDYDFILRLFKKKLNFFYMNNYITKMRYGGDSNKNLKNILTKTYEDFLILKKNKIKFPFFALTVKNISKIKQFIK
tara:strand:+ start:254 stop:988 length:735 start_codon:yes stop_codon:yes gene_type:complete